MDAITQFSDWMVRALDVPLGWLLLLPRDATLFVFSLLTALLMTLARRWVTNQDLLRRCAADLRQLKQLNREAKQAGDKPRRQRLRDTVALVRRMLLSEDMKVLAVVLVPIAVLAMWATERLDYLPPRVGRDFSLRVSFSASAINEVTHFVPIHGVELQTPAIQIVQPDDQNPFSGRADWTLRALGTSEELTLTIRHRGESITHRVAIGRPTYLPPRQFHQGDRMTKSEVLLTRYRPLNLDLRLESLGLPPWMIGYLVLTLLFVPRLKRVLRVA